MQSYRCICNLRRFKDDPAESFRSCIRCRIAYAATGCGCSGACNLGDGDAYREAGDSAAGCDEGDAGGGSRDRAAVSGWQDCAVVCTRRWEGSCVFLRCTTVDEAKAIMEGLPLHKAGYVEMQYVPVGPLTPLRLLTGKPATVDDPAVHQILKRGNYCAARSIYGPMVVRSVCYEADGAPDDTTLRWLSERIWRGGGAVCIDDEGGCR